MVIKKIWASMMLAASVSGAATAQGPAQAASSPPQKSEITVPAGFKATIFADGVGRPRHMAVSDSGWVYAALMRPVKGFGAVAFFDRDGDGICDERLFFAKGLRGTGMGIHNGYLYYGTDVSVIRWKLPEGGVPEEKPELIAYGFTQQRQHASKPFTFDDQGGLYVTVGAPSNACKEKMRVKESPGMDPCPILEGYGGIWRFDADTLMQEQKNAHRYATGIRNAMALDWNPRAGSLYLVQHGRDQLAEFYPESFTVEQSAELPAEEFHRVADGADLGWPYSYYDQVKGARMMMPEYGGDGVKLADRGGQKPLIGFPGHWAPNDMLFLRTDKWPEKYRMGAFIAFHGSWNRAPMPQQGYKLVYVPMDADGNLAGAFETFAGNFTRKADVMTPREAAHRPTGLAEGPDGSLYISSMQGDGRIWKVQYVGE